MNDIEILLMIAINLFFMSIVIWRIESIRDAIQDDIASIERIRHLDEFDSIVPKFADGSEK